MTFVYPTQKEEEVRKKNDDLDAQGGSVVHTLTVEKKPLFDRTARLSPAKHEK